MEKRQFPVDGLKGRMPMVDGNPASRYLLDWNYGADCQMPDLWQTC